LSTWEPETGQRGKEAFNRRKGTKAKVTGKKDASQGNASHAVYYFLRTGKGERLGKRSLSFQESVKWSPVVAGGYVKRFKEVFNFPNGKGVFEEKKK